MQRLHMRPLLPAGGNAEACKSPASQRMRRSLFGWPVLLLAQLYSEASPHCPSTESQGPRSSNVYISRALVCFVQSRGPPRNGTCNQMALPKVPKQSPEGVSAAEPPRVSAWENLSKGARQPSEVRAFKPHRAGSMVWPTGLLVNSPGSWNAIWLGMGSFQHAT